MTTESRSWPLLNERAPFATATHARRRRRTPRSTLLLTALAFICGGLISAAAFSMGWRHQAQRDSAARTALAAATARTQQLEHRIARLQTSLGSARATAASAVAAQHALARAGTQVGADASATTGSAASISSGAGSITAAAARIESELETLGTYLTTTPAGQLDPGYIASQTAYLDRQLRRLQGDGGTLGSSIASLDAALRRLRGDANGLIGR
jgi:prefoldin subunit 5